MTWPIYRLNRQNWCCSLFIWYVPTHQAAQRSRSIGWCVQSYTHRVHQLERQQNVQVHSRAGGPISESCDYTDESEVRCGNRVRELHVWRMHRGADLSAVASRPERELPALLLHDSVRSGQYFRFSRYVTQFNLKIIHFYYETILKSTKISQNHVVYIWKKFEASHIFFWVGLQLSCFQNQLE